MSFFGSRDFRLDVASNLVPGYEVVNIYGVSPIVGPNLEDIWNAGGLHTDMAAGSTLQISSTNVADTAIIQIIGVDASYNRQTMQATLNGQNAVTVPGTWSGLIQEIRVRPDQALPAGVIYLSINGSALTGGVPTVASTIQAKIDLYPSSSTSYGRSQNTFYTIPAGYSGIITFVTQGTYETANYNLDLAVKLIPTGSYLSFIPSFISQNNLELPGITSNLISEFSSIKARVERSGTGTQSLFYGYSLIIIDNNYL